MLLQRERELVLTIQQGPMLNDGLRDGVVSILELVDGARGKSMRISIVDDWKTQVEGFAQGEEGVGFFAGPGALRWHVRDIRALEA